MSTTAIHPSTNCATTTTGTMKSPTMPDPTETNFLSEILHRPVRSVVSNTDMSGDGGNSGGDLSRLVVEFADDDVQVLSIVCKQTTSARSIASSQQMGLAREAFFYQFVWNPEDEDAKLLLDNQRRHHVQSLLPKVYFTQADSKTGVKRILMQDLFATDASSNSASVAIQSGYLFGPGSPLNWNKDLEQLTHEIRSLSDTPLTMKRVTQSTFRTVAALHAAFWNDKTLLQHEWLRASRWMVQSAKPDQASWEALQARCATAWSNAKEGIKESSEIRWDPLVVACLDASIAKAKWGAFQTELQHRPFTLVHGDFHPGNVVTRISATNNGTGELETSLFDFEMVGVGSGPQDLGQYMISHVPPKERRDMENEVVRDYYETLCSENASIRASMTWDECWKEYTHGGLARWLWFLPVLTAWFPTPAVQYFHDQVADVLRTHQITPETVPMPRV